MEASSDVDEATAESLKIRNIRTVMLLPEVNCAIPVRRSLVKMAPTGTLENLIIQCRIPASPNSPCQCPDSSLPGLESWKCLGVPWSLYSKDNCIAICSQHLSFASC